MNKEEKSYSESKMPTYVKLIVLSKAQPDRLVGLHREGRGGIWKMH
jgi:hypothetical protein